MDGDTQELDSSTDSPSEGITHKDSWVISRRGSCCAALPPLAAVGTAGLTLGDELEWRARPRLLEAMPALPSVGLPHFLGGE